MSPPSIRPDPQLTWTAWWACAMTALGLTGAVVSIALAWAGGHL